MTITNVPIRKYSNDDISDLIGSIAAKLDAIGFHLTIVYRNAPTVSAANSFLNAFMRRFYPLVVSTNYHRQAYRDLIQPFYFLDVPGSRHGNSPHKIAHSQDGYHHHCILLIARPLAEKLMARWFPSDLKSREWKELNLSTPARSHLLQPLTTLGDLKRCAAYASKSVPYLINKHEDAYLLPRKESLLPLPMDRYHSTRR